MRDLVIVAAVLLGFAILVTTHLAIVVGLVRKHPRWRALAALVLVPMAPYYALVEGMRKRGILWLLASTIYVVALVLALRAR